MTEHESQSFNKSIVRLGFTPSPELGDSLRGFYKEDFQPPDKDIAINSLEGFYINLYGQSDLIRPYPYKEEPHGVPNLATRIKEFEQKYLSQIAGQRIPLASAFSSKRSKHDAWQLLLRILPNDIQKKKLDSFLKLYDSSRVDLNDPGRNVETRIFPAQRAIGRTALTDAKERLSYLLVPKIRAGQMSKYALRNALVDNPDVFVTPNPKLSITPIPRLVDDNSVETDRTA